MIGDLSLLSELGFKTVRRIWGSNWGFNFYCLRGLTRVLTFCAFVCVQLVTLQNILPNIEFGGQSFDALEGGDWWHHPHWVGAIDLLCP